MSWASPTMARSMLVAKHVNGSWEWSPSSCQSTWACAPGTTSPPRPEHKTFLTLRGPWEQCFLKSVADSGVLNVQTVHAGAVVAHHADDLVPGGSLVALVVEFRKRGDDHRYPGRLGRHLSFDGLAGQ